MWLHRVRQLLVQFLLRAIKIALRSNKFDFIACICTLSQRCAALVQCDNCHNQSQTWHKSHDKWNMAASGVVWTPLWIKSQVIAVCAASSDHGATKTRDLKQTRTVTAGNKQLTFPVKNKPHTTNYIYCIFEAYFMIKSAWKNRIDCFEVILE